MLQLAASDYKPARFRPTIQCTSPGFFFPSAFAVGTTLFFISFETSEKPLPCFSEEPPSGFGYPRDGVSWPQPWKFLNFQRSWDSLFRALFLFNDRRKFPVLLSTPALSSETFRLRTGASVAFSHQRSCAPVCYLKNFSRRGRLLS